LATAGKDRKIRIYDETTKTMAFQMKQAGDLHGHSNRIFCVKFNPNDPNMVVSGGWDRTVQIYDLRVRGPVNFFYGPHICGETIDFRNDSPTMVTGSYRMDEPLECWDLRMFKRSKVIEWDGTGQKLFHADEDSDESEMGMKPSPSTASMAGMGAMPRVTKKPKGQLASFLYTTMFSKD
jgi:WD40 repeat protein